MDDNNKDAQRDGKTEVERERRILEIEEVRLVSRMTLGIISRYFRILYLSRQAFRELRDVVPKSHITKEMDSIDNRAMLHAFVTYIKKQQMFFSPKLLNILNYIFKVRWREQLHLLPIIDFETFRNFRRIFYFLIAAKEYILFLQKVKAAIIGNRFTKDELIHKVYYELSIMDNKYTRAKSDNKTEVERIKIMKIEQRHFRVAAIYRQMYRELRNVVPKSDITKEMDSIYNSEMIRAFGEYIKNLQSFFRPELLNTCNYIFTIIWKEQSRLLPIIDDARLRRRMHFLVAAKEYILFLQKLTTTPR